MWAWIKGNSFFACWILHLAVEILSLFYSDTQFLPALWPPAVRPNSAVFNWRLGADRLDRSLSLLTARLRKYAKKWQKSIKNNSFRSIFRFILLISLNFVECGRCFLVYVLAQTENALFREWKRERNDGWAGGVFQLQLSEGNRVVV